LPIWLASLSVLASVTHTSQRATSAGWITTSLTCTVAQSATESAATYGAEGYVFQQKADLFTSAGKTAVIGSWYVTDEGPAAIGIRESDGPITDVTARFVPHFVQ
jgi:glutathionylspermidine synthase